jgi:hypothetical protein
MNESRAMLGISDPRSSITAMQGIAERRHTELLHASAKEEDGIRRVIRCD